MSISLNLILKYQLNNKPTSCLAVSRDSKLTKTVIWSKKSNSSAIPAYRANDLTAGIPEIAPRKKQNASEMAVSNIDGPTSPRIRPMCFS